MNKIEHIGIAVKDLEASLEIYRNLLGVECYKKEEVDSEKVITAFFHCGESKIELLAPTDEKGPIAKFLEKRGEGIHHIAFAVDNIREEVKRLKEKGFVVLNEDPKKGADNKWVVFLHPKSSSGVLVELCEDRNIE
jgi:methylmalonyl-CoA/ethylmalonyl-CoA epimerase